MTLRKKAILFFTAFFIVWSSVLIFFMSGELLTGYKKVEEVRFKWQIERVQHMLDDLITRHEPLMKDWASWDDAYIYVQYPSDMFLEDIKESNHFIDQEMNYYIFYNEEGETLHSAGYDLEMGRDKPVPQGLIDVLPQYKNESGLLIIDGNPIVFITQEVVNNDATAPPKGLFAFAYDLTATVVEETGRSIHETISLHSIDVSSIQSIVEPVMDESYQDSYVRINYPYVNANKYIQFHLALDHSIIALGIQSSYSIMVIFITAFAVFFIVAMGTVDNVVRRIGKIDTELETVIEDGYINNRMEPSGDDEIGSLRHSINDLLDELQDVHDQLIHHATFDELTGVLNRRAGIEKLEMELEKVTTSKEPITIVFIDVDDLKEVNDTYGHNVGDDYLIHICHSIKMVLGFDDSIVRLGGDEFIAVFCNKTAEEVGELFKPVHQHISSVHDQYSLPYEMSISAGVFEYTEGMTVDEFIESADEKMYIEKMRYKNSKS